MIDFTDPINFLTFMAVICFLCFLFYYHDNTNSIRDLQKNNKSLEKKNSVLKDQNVLFVAILNKHLPHWRHIKVVKKSDISSDDGFYHCEDCGSEFKDEFVDGKLMIFCPHCDPVQYCEKTGKPYKSKCDCAQCVH